MPTNCPVGKILNPTTNRCVKIHGKIGKQLQNLDEKPRNLQNMPKVVNSRPSKKSFIETTWHHIHPDTYLSNEAKKQIESHIDSLLDLAGALTRYERNKKTCSEADIKQAISIIGKGRDFEAKELERLDKKRLAQFERFK